MRARTVFALSEADTPVEVPVFASYGGKQDMLRFLSLPVANLQSITIYAAVDLYKSKEVRKA